MLWQTWAARALAWRGSRSLAWGLRLGRREATLVGLTRRSGADVRVVLLERWRAPEALQQAQAIDAWLAQAVLASSAQVRAPQRHLTLALSASRCATGEFTVSADLPARERVKQVRAQVHEHLREHARDHTQEPIGEGMHQAVGVVATDWALDMQPHTEAHEDADIQTRLHWAACPQSMLDQWCGLARQAGWRLDAVEPQQQAHARAMLHSRQAALADAVDSPQDWQFALTPQRSLPLAQTQAQAQAQGQVQQDSAREKLWVACGAALGAWV